MSTAPSPLDPAESPLTNPFFYGFRYQFGVDERGRETFEQIPLTEDDVLHPREGYWVGTNEDHQEDIDYLHDVIAARLAPEPRTLVTQDLLITWDVPDLRDHCPDIAVIRGVRQRRRKRRDSFNVAGEGVRPELIIEVTSPATRNVDLNRKRREYWLAKVPVYVIVDEEFPGGQRHLRLLGYKAGKRGYRQFKPDQQGRLWLEAAGLWLGQENGRVALYDEEGKRQESYLEMTQRAEEAEERARHAEAELERLRALLGGRQEEE